MKYICELFMFYTQRFEPGSVRLLYGNVFWSSKPATPKLGQFFPALFTRDLVCEHVSSFYVDEPAMIIYLDTICLTCSIQRTRRSSWIRYLSVTSLTDFMLSFVMYRNFEG